MPSRSISENLTRSRNSTAVFSSWANGPSPLAGIGRTKFSSELAIISARRLSSRQNEKIRFELNELSKNRICMQIKETTLLLLPCFTSTTRTPTLIISYLLACFLPSFRVYSTTRSSWACCLVFFLLLSCGLSTDGVVVTHDELQSAQKGLDTGPCQRIGLNDFAVHDTIGLDNEQAWLSKQGRLL